MKSRKIFFSACNNYFNFICLIAISFILASCNNNNEKAVKSQGIYSAQNFTDLILDSNFVMGYVNTLTVSDTIKNELITFYATRDYQFAWFNKRGITHALPIFYNQLQNYRFDFADSSFDNPAIDSLMLVMQNGKIRFQLHPEKVQQSELIITTAFFKYAHKVYGGIPKSPGDLDWFIPRKKKNYSAVLDSMVSLSTDDKLHEPVNKYYTRLKKKLRRYRTIQINGGFPVIITSKQLFSAGDHDSCLFLVKQYLVLTDDLTVNDNTIIFTDSLKLAVLKFQHRMGLPETGIIDEPTLTELNIPVTVRISQMMVNMERLRWVPVKTENDYLLINIPEFRLHVFELGKPTWAMNVIVGKAMTQTNVFKGSLSQIVLNPYWNIPASIVRDEIVPKIKMDPSFLFKNNIEVLSGDVVVNTSKIKWNSFKTGIPYTMRQGPGKNNGLGKIKFLFPNAYSIYLHDAPSGNHFNESKRDFSHGCIRVEDPKKLALYLLRKQSDWTVAKYDHILDLNLPFTVPVNPVVPVYIVYFTSWVDDKGQLNFRHDLYNLDDQLSKDIYESANVF